MHNNMCFSPNLKYMCTSFTELITFLSLCYNYCFHLSYPLC